MHWRILLGYSILQDTVTADSTLLQDSMVATIKRERCCPFVHSRNIYAKFTLCTAPNHVLHLEFKMAKGTALSPSLRTGSVRQHLGVALPPESDALELSQLVNSAST